MAHKWQTMQQTSHDLITETPSAKFQSYAADASNLQKFQKGSPLSAEYPLSNEEPLRGGQPLILASPAVNGEFVYSPDIPLSYALQHYTYQACVEAELEYELVLALMWRESRFQTDAINVNTNGTKDSGIMQINDVNKEWLEEQHGIDDLLDPVQNIDAGIIMLQTFVEKYGIHDALMAYQYGEEGMKRQIERGVTTNDLIKKLMVQRNVYVELLKT